MELLKQRILQDGRCFPGGILKVDSFINHQMDPMLLYKVAEEFIYRFRDADINKIVTIEASGIAPAIMVGYIMHLPVVFIKKNNRRQWRICCLPLSIRLRKTAITRCVSVTTF